MLRRYPDVEATMGEARLQGEYGPDQAGEVLSPDPGDGEGQSLEFRAPNAKGFSRGPKRSVMPRAGLRLGAMKTCRGRSVER